MSIPSQLAAHSVRYPNDGRATSGYNRCDWDKTTNQIQLKTNTYPVQPITNRQEFSGLRLCYL
jgi:hypothetical protein